MKRKILYSDIPRPYDEEAARLARRVLTIGGTLFIMALCLIAISLGG